MKFIFSWFGCISLIFSVYGHDAHIAFFEILPVESKEIKVHAEFPWTLRDALVQFDSTLLLDKSKAIWEASFKKYVTEYLSMYDISHRELGLISIAQLPSTNSGHSVQYEFRFEGGVLGTIDNRLMFNLNNHQDNIHKIVGKKGDLEFITNKSSPNFRLENVSKKNYYLIIRVFVGIFLSLLLGINQKRKTEKLYSDAEKVHFNGERHSK